MNILALLASLLPNFIIAAEKIGGDAASGASKKEMVSDALFAVAGGVATVSPSNGTAASHAAAAAVASIDGVVQVLNDVGVLKGSTTTAIAAPAVPLTPVAVAEVAKPKAAIGL